MKIKNLAFLTAVLCSVFLANCLTYAADMTGWTARQQIILNDAQISGTNTNFPVLITGDHLTSQFFDLVQTAGDDIRFTTDSRGIILCQYELVSINTTTDTAEIYVVMPELSSTARELWVWYGNGTATTSTAPAVNSTAVWDSNFLAVYHMNQNPAPATAPIVFAPTSGEYNQTLNVAQWVETDQDGSLHEQSNSIVYDFTHTGTNGAATAQIKEIYTHGDVSFSFSNIFFSGSTTPTTAVAFQTRIYLQDSSGAYWYADHRRNTDGTYKFTWNTQAGGGDFGELTGQDSSENLEMRRVGSNMSFFSDNNLIKSFSLAANNNISTFRIQYYNNDNGSRLYCQSHLISIKESQIKDSTANNHAGVLLGGAATTATTVGFGVDFETDTMVSLGSATALVPQTTLTVESFSKVNSGNPGHLMSRESGTTIDYDFRETSASKLYSSIGSTSHDNESETTGIITPTSWHHSAYIYDGAGATDADRLQFRVNGANMPWSFTTGSAIPAQLHGGIPSSGDTLIGTNAAGTGGTDRTIDEFRLSSVARSTDWLDTTDEYLRNPSTFGTAGIIAPTSITLWKHQTAWEIDNGGVQDRTIRVKFHNHTPNTTGDTMRLRISGPKFAGTTPLDNVFIGIANNNSTTADWIFGTAPTRVTFSASNSTIIAAGQVVYSDPITLANATIYPYMISVGTDTTTATVWRGTTLDGESSCTTSTGNSSKVADLDATCAGWNQHLMGLELQYDTELLPVGYDQNGLFMANF